ncbi:putative aaa family [Phaeomoniella chlamydospora]|uniref:Putative aaa family n=1 Tax=Phaeomoniella chlamydospora TaxID=158046 RepID=A0A0G2EXU9_PHACM|nr:putative aaa family [Phaeomoniella chlamydospora]
MMRSKPYTSMQKTYDECYLTCSTAIYFERQDNEAEALRSWRSALNQIYHHNAYQIPTGYVPKTETERALHESLREMELQCKERVDILEALQKSRKDAEKEARRAAKEAKSLTKAAQKNGSSSSVGNSTNTRDGWIGNGTIPPVSVEDLAKPPTLPSRPSHASRGGSSESLVKQKTKNLPQIGTGSSSPLPAAPTLPVPSKKPSRSPSPEHRKTTMLTTLRKTDGKRKVASRSAVRKPPAASKAAGLAWDTTVKPPSIPHAPSLSTNSARVARKSLDDSRPVSDDEYRKFSTVTSPSPSDYIPTYSWREPQSPFQPSSSLDNDMRTLNISNNTASPGPDSFPPANEPAISRQSPSPPPPTPPPHDPNLRTRARPQPPPPRGTKPPELSYRREYPPASLKPGAASIGVKRPSSNSVIDPSGSGQATLSRKPVANTSTPRLERSRPSRGYTSASSGSEEQLNTKTTLQAPRPRAVRQHSKQKVPRPETPPSSDESSPDPNLERAWEARCKAIMKDLPRGVDEAAAKQILNDIVVQGDEVHWSDIAGLEGAKKALKEAVVYPFLRPDLFMGLREPARGMLLFGPPGTGKTMLARAVATESKSTFFAISASSLTSKWHGDSEKLVRALFALAKKLAPSIIFVDEIDSLLSSRSSSSEHEASRRSKTEFLIQWSDLQRAAAGRDIDKDRRDREGDPSRVLVLAATNVPWDIDEAARRRFVRRQYIPLPEAETRRTQLLTLLSHQKHELNQEDLEVLVRVTEGFSGSDITSLAKDAAMGPLRNLGEALLYTPMDQIRPILFEDFEASLVNIRPSVSKEGLKAFEDWSREFGERGG